jgi:hypothetical protein
MQISLDGGETYVDAPQGVRIVIDDVTVQNRSQSGPGEDSPVGLHINCTHEGVICDAWGGDSNLGTSSEMYEDLVERLVAENE